MHASGFDNPALTDDVTNRKQLEEALRLSYDQLAVILQGVADGITAQGPTGHLIYANEAAARILRYPSTEALIGTPPPQIMDKFELLDEFGQPFPFERLPGRLALQGERSPSAMIRFRIKATHEEHWSDVKARPIFNEAGEVELVVSIFQDVTTLKQSERSQHLLAEASKVLSASLDYENTLHTVARLVILLLADYCTVHMIDEAGRIRSVVEAHVDPQQEVLLRELNHHYPPGLDPTRSLVGEVLRAGAARLIPEVTAPITDNLPVDDRLQGFLADLSPKSAMIVPLTARGQTLGAFTLVWSKSGRRYGPADLAVAKELADRVALAIENARLYQEAQTLNVELERRVTRRTAELQATNNKLAGEIAERKQVENALRKSKTWFEGLFESAPDTTVLVNGEGRIIRVNKQVEAMFGYTQTELQDKPVEILLPTRFRGRHVQHRSTYYAEPRIRSMGVGLELYGRRKDGSEFPVEITLSPLETEAGTLVISVVRDITRRKQAGGELQRMKEFSERLINSSLDGIFAFNRECRYTVWNPGMERISGLSKANVLGRCAFEVFPFLKETGEDKYFYETLTGKATIAKERPYTVLETGRTGFFEGYYSPIRDEADGVVGGLAIIRDITERKQAEESLRASEARFRTVFEGAGIGILLLNMEGRIIASNPAFQKILGYKTEELSQLTLSDITHPADHTTHLNLFQALATGKRALYRLEIRYLRQGGDLVWGYLSASLIRNTEGEPQFIVNMVKDITERKQMEAELAEVQHRLMESREAERLHVAQELHDGPLQDLYAVSYQLNEMWEVLPDEPSRGKLVTTQVTIQRTIQTLRALCGELRPPALAPFGLEKAIRSHAESFQKTHPKLAVKLELMPDGPALPEQVRLALFRVYQQAMSNIVRHAQANHILVRFELTSEAVILEIKDDGCGFEMPARWVELARGGHLGLVGASERTEAINGNLTIKSAPGKGTLIRATAPHLNN
jgi:PAS domain S-box-containing protein